MNLLTAEQVAERWALSTRAVYRLTREGKLEPAVVRLGRYRRYRLDGIERIERDGGTGEET